LCDKKLFAELHVRQIWSRSSEYSDDNRIAYSVVAPFFHRFPADNVYIIFDPGAGALQNAFAKYSEAPGRKRQVHPVLVAGQDEGESRDSEHQAWK